MADLDQDGDLDVILKNRNSPQLRLLRNEVMPGYNAASFDLRGRRSNRDAVGAKIILETNLGSRTKFVKIGSGFLSQSSRRVWFGLKNQEGIPRVKVEWPSGEVQTFRDLPANHRITIVEGVDKVTTHPFRSPNQSGDWYSEKTESPSDKTGSPSDKTGSPSDKTGSPSDKTGSPVEAPLPYTGTWLLEELAAPQFRLPDVNGRLHELSMYRGRKVLLNFWATWCPPCREEMRDLRLHQKDLEALNTTILAISVDDPADHAKVKAYAKEKELKFTVLLADDDVVAAFNLVNRFLFGKIRDLALPTSMLLDSNGNILKIYRGRVPTEQIIRDIRHTPRSEEELIRAAFPFPGQSLGMEFFRDHTLIADAFRRAGLDQQAAIYYRHQLMEQGHHTAESWNSLGVIYIDQGQLDEALEAFGEALRLNPDYAESHNNLGHIYGKTRQIDKAIDSYRNASRLAPWLADIQNNLGHELVKKGLLEQAIKAYERAHQIEGQAAEPLIYLGNTYLKMKRFQGAIIAFGKALEIQQDSASYHQKVCK